MARGKARTSKMDRKLTKPDGSTKARPRQPDLPGTEDRAIKPLEESAAAYADIRDQRMALNVDEAKLKATLLTLMKKHGKSVYHRNGITIQIVQEEETVRVRVKKADDDEDESEFAEARAAAVQDA